MLIRQIYHAKPIVSRHNLRVDGGYVLRLAFQIEFPTKFVSVELETTPSKPDHGFTN